MEQVLQIKDVAHKATLVGSKARVAAEAAIVLCFDRQYEFNARVTLLSVLLNSAFRNFNVYMITNGLTEEDTVSLDNFAKKFGIAITLMSVEYGIIKELQTHFYFTHATYLRWLAPLLIIEPVLLYLDSDLIVQSDIESLFALAQSDKIVGGVEDLRGGSIRREELGLKPGDPYLNAGVLIINSERWRSCQISQKAIRFAQEFKGPLWGADQDALNCVVEQEKFVIDGKWNVQTFTIGYYGLGQRFDADRFDGIFHYSGEVKPWMRWADPWGQKFYMKYASVLGIPANFWSEPKTVGQRLLQARAADEERDYARANDIRRGILTLIVNSDDGTLWRRACE